MTPPEGRCTVSHMSENASVTASGSWLRSLIGTLGRTRVGRFFSERFGDVSKSEAWGYAVWGSMGVVIAVPELWAAVWGDNSRWPTISTTVGHLEDRWPVVALAPVALLAGFGYQLLRFKPAVLTVQADLQGLGRTQEGRLTKVDFATSDLRTRTDLEMIEAGRQSVSARLYFAIAAIVVGVGWVGAATLGDNRFVAGYLLYSLVAVFWVLIPNALAYWWRKDVPFTTLFFTMRQLDGRLHFATAVVAALLAILLLHLAFYPWPSIVRE
jgi:hypothetical protein